MHNFVMTFEMKTILGNIAKPFYLCFNEQTVIMTTKFSKKVKYQLDKIENFVV